MNDYFYHGIEFYYGTVGYTIQLFIKILNEGLILRSQVHGSTDESLNHICLYKKNNDFDYSDNSPSFNSARDGWIDGQFVFIINPEIKARKAELNSETDLVDEWRCYENIPPTNFVGIALPFNSINEYINEKCNYYDEEEEKDKEIAEQYLPALIEKAKSMGLDIVDSEEDNFTDTYNKNNSNRVL